MTLAVYSRFAFDSLSAIAIFFRRFLQLLTTEKVIEVAKMRDKDAVAHRPFWVDASRVRGVERRDGGDLRAKSLEAPRPAMRRGQAEPVREFRKLFGNFLFKLGVKLRNQAVGTTALPVGFRSRTKLRAVGISRVVSFELIEPVVVRDERPSRYPKDFKDSPAARSSPNTSP